MVKARDDLGRRAECLAQVLPFSCTGLDNNGAHSKSSYPSLGEEVGERRAAALAGARGLVQQGEVELSLGRSEDELLAVGLGQRQRHDCPRESLWVGISGVRGRGCAGTD